MKNRKILSIFFKILVVVLFLSCIFYYFKADKTSNQNNQSKITTKQVKDSALSTDKRLKGLPQVSPDDWELILVNRENTSEELNPEVTDVGGILVNAKIADQTLQFLTAAQAIDPNEHLISGYRSVAQQTELYQAYVAQEIAANPSLSKAEAEETVQTYSQPPGASEHMTGLAVDMSAVDSLNQNNPEIVKKLVKMAPKYGFVLRFPEGKTNYTGVGYEDWHFRYVGQTSAEYMTEHKLSLEEYLKLVKENQ